jgi:hypothetical protein
MFSYASFVLSLVRTCGFDFGSGSSGSYQPHRRGLRTHRRLRMVLDRFSSAELPSHGSTELAVHTPLCGIVVRIVAASTAEQLL